MKNSVNSYAMEAYQNAHVFAGLGDPLPGERMALLHFDAGLLEVVEGYG